MNHKWFIQANTTRYWKATIALSIGSFLVFSNLHMAQPLLPLFTNDFNISPAAASLTVSLVTLTLSIFLILFGPVSDAIGRKKVMSVGILLSSILSLSIFFAPNFFILLILRTLQGIFLASLPAIAYAYIGEEFEPQSVAVVIGIYISGNSIGGMGGRIISGLVADLFGWRYSFLIMGIIGLISYLVFIVLLPNSINFTPKKFSRKNAIHDIFIHWKNPKIRNAYFVAGIIYFIFIGLFNYLGFHLHQEPYSLSTTFIGLLYLTYIAGTFSSTYSGKLSNRLSISQRIFIGLLIMLVGVLLLLAKPLIILLLGVMVVVFGFFFTHAASSSWVSHHASSAKASASAMYLFSYYFGGSIGSSLLGYIWAPYGWTALIMVLLAFVLIGMGISYKMRTMESGVVIQKDPSL